MAHFVVQPVDETFDFLAVREVLRQALARRVQKRGEHDAAAPLRMSGQQVVERVEAAEDVLRQLDAVDAHEQLPVADRLVEHVAVRRSHADDSAVAARSSGSAASG